MHGLHIVCERSHVEAVVSLSWTGMALKVRHVALQAKQPPFNVEKPAGQGLSRVCELCAPEAVVQEACKQQAGSGAIRDELLRQAFEHAQKALKLHLCRTGHRLRVRCPAPIAVVCSYLRNASNPDLLSQQAVSCESGAAQVATLCMLPC